MESGFSLLYATKHHYTDKLTVSTLQKDYRGDNDSQGVRNELPN